MTLPRAQRPIARVPRSAGGGLQAASPDPMRWIAGILDLPSDNLSLGQRSFPRELCKDRSRGCETITTGTCTGPLVGGGTPAASGFPHPKLLADGPTLPDKRPILGDDVYGADRLVEFEDPRLTDCRARAIIRP
jgi:hypothetical protein